MDPSNTLGILAQKNARCFACKFWGLADLPEAHPGTPQGVHRLQTKELWPEPQWGAGVRKQLPEPASLNPGSTTL